MLKSDNPPPLTLAVQSGRRSFSSVRACWGRLPRKGKIFACVVLLPTVAVFLYYLLWASPMYVSQTRFAIRSADSSGGGLDIASALLRSSSSTGADAHIVVEYIQSLDIIHDIDKELGVDLHFSDKGHDVFSRLTNNPTQDRLLQVAGRVFPPSDQMAGISSWKCHSPGMAQKIAAAVLAPPVITSEYHEPSVLGRTLLHSRTEVRGRRRIRKAGSCCGTSGCVIS